jgi:hypothetical protein
MRTRPGRDGQQTTHCAYSTPCGCGRSYIAQTGRSLAVRLRKYTLNLKEGLLEKPKLAQHTYEAGPRVIWDEARILEIESNSRHRKYKGSAHMACFKNSISQLSFEISVI